MNRGFIKPPKTVIAINPDGSVCAVFNNSKDAAKMFGVIPNTINRYCFRQRIGMGKRGLYEEDFRAVYMRCELDKLKFELPEDYAPGKSPFQKGHKLGNGWEKKSEEYKQRTREMALERINSVNKSGANTRGVRMKMKQVVCLNDGMEFPSIQHAANHYGISRNMVSWSAHKTRTAHGLKFRFKSQLEKIKEVI